MKDKDTCSTDCCKDFYDDYNEDDDNYVIQRLLNIISICEFLIEHERNKKSRQILDDILDQAEKESKESAKKSQKYVHRIYPYYVPYHRNPWNSKEWYWF